MVELLDGLALAYLKFRKRRALKGMRTTETPILLLGQYRKEYETNPRRIREAVAELYDRPLSDLKPSLIEADEYHHFKASLNSRLGVFANRPFQLGALDVEIDVIVEALSQLDEPEVLEIGVANGYSSACIFYAVKRAGGRITLMDLPRFSSTLTGHQARIREALAKKGKIKNTGTLVDLNPGGVVPVEKYAGWLIPMELRMIVRHTMIYGDVFQILADLPDIKFDFVVLDAMKDYQVRLKILDLITEHLRPNGLCFLDGYWLNSAFTDFCSRNDFPEWHFGRVGVFAKRPRT